MQTLLPDWEVINAGVIGFESGNEFALLSSRILALKPALVIDLTGWNDFSSSSANKRDQRTAGIHGFGQIETELERWSRATYSNYFYRLTQVPRTLFRETAMLMLGHGPGSGRRPVPPPGQETLGYKAALAAFEKYIRLSNHLVRAEGGKYLVAFQPAFATERNVSSLPHEAYGKFVREASEHLKGVPQINLSVVTFENEDFLDPIHLSDRGSAKIAARFASVVTAR